METCRVNCDNQPNGGEDSGDYAAGAIKMQRYNHGDWVVFCRYLDHGPNGKQPASVDK